MRTYNCVVCVKQVPDTKKVTGDAMKADGTINRAALPAIFNPEDKNALEAALQVRDKCGGTVTVLTMGLPAAKAPTWRAHRTIRMNTSKAKFRFSFISSILSFLYDISYYI